MVKVTIIIPVYNGEAYLHQCLNSVCAQTLEEIEVICVDDGSTDGSWEILESYRKKDPRFRLIRQEHKYLPTARNSGLAQAQGKYVIFWDCDDFFESNALELLYMQAEKTDADICVCKNDLYSQRDGKRYSENASLNLKRVPKEETFNRFSNPEHILSFTNIPVWNKLFLRSFLLENDLIFPDFRMSEDYAFVAVALCLATKITTVNKVLIHYRWLNPESQMAKRPGGILEDLRAIEFAMEQLWRKDIVPAGLGKKTIGTIMAILQRTETEAEFVTGLTYLRQPGVWEKFGIRERESEYYAVRHYEYVKRLLHDEPGDVLAFFMYEGRQRLKVVNADRRKTKVQLKQLKKRFAKNIETFEGKIATLVAEKEALAEENNRLTMELEQATIQLTAYQKKLQATKKQLKKTKETLCALQSSRSYRLGRALLYLPRKIQELFLRAAHGEDARHD